MSQVTDTADSEVLWAVQWRANGPLVETGHLPPWSADYGRWVHHSSPVVFRKIITRTTVVEESEWREVPA